MWEGREILGEKMKPAMFRYKMALAGYSDYNIKLIEGCMYDESGFITSEESRYAVCEYAKVSKNVQMVPLYIGLVASLYLNSMFEWEDAVKWVLTIVIGWGL